MKKLMRLGLAGLSMAAMFALTQLGCESTPTQVMTPPTATPTNTSTNTYTSTRTNTPTVTNTPGGPTNTPTNTPTVTSTVGTTPLIIFDEALYVATGESEFDGGGGAVTGSDLADLTAPYAGTKDAMWSFGNCGGGGYVGWNVTGPSTDLSAYTTISFWAKTNRAYTGNGIEFFGGGNSMTNHLFAVTTTYTQYSYTFNQPSNNTTIFFGVVINTADVSDLPGGGPVSVFVDNIQYQ